MGNAFNNFMTGLSGAMQQQRGGESGSQPNLQNLVGGVLGALQQGIQNANNTSGLTAQDRAWIQQTSQQTEALLQVATPLFAFMEQNLGGNWENQASGMTE